MSPPVRPAETREIHDLEHERFLEEVHSFEFWFHSVEGYLSGTTYGHRTEVTDDSPRGPWTASG